MHCRLLTCLFVAGGLLSWGPSARAQQSPEACLKVLLDHHAALVKIVEEHTSKPQCVNTLIKLNAYSNRKKNKLVNAQRCLKTGMQNMPKAKLKGFMQKLMRDSMQAEGKEQAALKAFKKTCPMHHDRVDKFINDAANWK